MLAPTRWSSTMRWLALLVIAIATTMFALGRRDPKRAFDGTVALNAAPDNQLAGPTVQIDCKAPLASGATRVAGADSIVTTEVMAPSAGVLHGVLVRPDRGPTGDGHTVVLIETDDDGAPRSNGGRIVVTPEFDGRFEIRLPDWAHRAPVLLVGRARHHLPAMLILRPVRDVAHDEVELLLEEGDVLRGRIVHGGDPVVGWPVELDLRFGVPGVSKAGSEGFWLTGRFVEKHARATTGAQGQFEFRGLVRDRYDLRCARIAPAIPSEHTEEVRVDGTDVLIDLAGAELAVVVNGAGGTLEGVDVHVNCGAGETHFRGGRNPTVITLPAHTLVTFLAEHGSHASLETSVMTGARGERIETVFTLIPALRPALRVWLPGAHDAKLAQLSLDLLPLDGSAGERRLELRRQTGRDEFWLDVLPASPGRHALRLGSVGDFRSEVKEFEVPEGGVVEVAFAGERGGRFAVELESDLAQWSAQWRIRDDQGREAVPARYLTVEAGEESETTTFEVHDAKWHNLVPDVDVLPPGRYRLEVESDQHSARSVDFEIVVGDVARLGVRLLSK
jgi:hypothetical protein